MSTDSKKIHELCWSKAPPEATHYEISNKLFYKVSVKRPVDNADCWDPGISLWMPSGIFMNADLLTDQFIAKNPMSQAEICQIFKVPEYTGGSVNYYSVEIKKPTNPKLHPCTVECNDIIEALGMNYAEGNAFKAIWRSCAARNLGLAKAGYKDGLYDAEKVVFFGQRMVEQAGSITK